MKPIGIVLLVIAIILVAAMIVLYFLGKKAQKKKEEQDEQMKAAAQTVTMLIIDKKRMKMKDAGLPSQVMEQANKLMQRAKLPIVKAKVGPRVMTLIADEQIYDDIPVKKEVKATVSGIYLTSVKAVFISQAYADSVDRWKNRSKRKKDSVQSFRKSTMKPMPS